MKERVLKIPVFLTSSGRTPWANFATVAKFAYGKLRPQGSYPEPGPGAPTAYCSQYYYWLNYPVSSPIAGGSRS